MARRYYRRTYRRGRKKDPIEALFGLIFLGAVASFMQQSGSEFTIENLLAYLLTAVFIVFAVAIVGILAFKFGKELLAKLNRKQMFQEYRSVEEILGLHPKEFENFVAAVFENRGYKVNKVTGYVKDHGIDVVLEKAGKKYAVQAKRYSRKNYVKEHEVRDFFGSYIADGYAGGFFVTTSFFSKPAKEWAHSRGVNLVSGKKLLTMMNSYHLLAK